MYYFHDSAVILGFIFRGADRWGNQAYKIIEDPIQNHSSKYVWEECFGGHYDDGAFNKGKCGWIKSKITRESRRVIRGIKQNIPLKEIIDSIEEDEGECKTEALFEKLCNKYGTSPNFSQNLENAMNQFEALCYKRYKELNDGDKITRFTRKKGYNDIYTELKMKIENESDIEIIIDGHHLATQIQPVQLITGDKIDIYSNRDTILQKTLLNDIIWLGNLD